MIKQLEDRLNAIKKIAFAHYEAGVELSSHSKGREREVFVSEFLSKVFPNGYRFSSGDIVDLKGSTAGQVDLVLEFPYEPSFPMPWGEERLILSHSVIAALEIKSSIDQWQEVLIKSDSISWI